MEKPANSQKIKIAHIGAGKPTLADRIHFLPHPDAFNPCPLPTHTTLFIPYKKDGVFIGKVLQVKIGGYIYKQILEACGGKLPSKLWLEDIKPSDNIVSAWVCSCGEVVTVDDGMVMLKDDLWLTYFKEKDVACVACIEKAMGRSITIDDLGRSDGSLIPVNIIFAKQRGLIK
jgi:hypothetical protein